MSHHPARRDRYGLPLSTGSSLATERYVQGLDLILSGNLGSEEHLRQAVTADEGFALAHAALATVELQAGQADAARERLQLARERVSGTTRRERQHIEVVAEATLGSRGRALALAGEHLDDFPNDAFILRHFTPLRISEGCQGMKAAVLDAVERLAPAYGDDWYYTGMRSFYLHELDRVAESRHYAEKSLAGNPRNGNAVHSIAHCFYETSDYTGGVDFLDGWMLDYPAAGPSYCHLSWHLALFELAQGRYRRSFDIYEQSIRPSVLRQQNAVMGPPLSDAASLFWRYKLYGLPAEDSAAWREIEAFAETVATGPLETFNDAHCAMAFAVTGNQQAMTALIERLQAAAAQGDALIAEVGLPLVLGIEAFGRGDYGQVVRYIEPIANDIARIPGSQAQRRVFEETLLRAHMLAGNHEQAERMLRDRLEHRHAGRDLFWLAAVTESRTERDAAHTYRERGLASWTSADADAPELQRAG